METKNLFEVGKKYTIFQINSMAITIKTEIEVTEIIPEQSQVIFKMRNGRKRLVLPLETRHYASAPLESFKGAVFEGWDQPIKCDSETSIFRGNACYNFMSLARWIKDWIDKNQLNPAFEKYRVLACGAKEDTEELVYPELYQGGHAVLDRILLKKGDRNAVKI